jgi:hypothetical protein
MLWSKSVEESSNLGRPGQFEPVWPQLRSLNLRWLSEFIEEYGPIY